MMPSHYLLFQWESGICVQWDRVKHVALKLLTALVTWIIHSCYDCWFLSLRSKAELNKEVASYLQDFPEEMLFHTSNLHLLDSVGQGNIMFAAYLHCSHKFLISRVIVAAVTCLLTKRWWDYRKHTPQRFGQHNTLTSDSRSYT